MNTRWAYWMAQLTGWTVYTSLLVVAVYSSEPEKLNLNLFIAVTSLIVLGIGTTHIQRIIFFKLGWLDIKLVKLIPRLVLSSLLCAIVIALGSFAVGELKQPLEGEGAVGLTELIMNIFALSILTLFWNAIYFTYHFFQKSRKQEISNLELTASNRESELKNLRSQLNPHFLFNSLNSIKALVDIEPVKAKTSITTLSNLLRQSLVLGKESKVSLSGELEMVRSYLDLEKVRFEERLDVQWLIDDQLFQVQIPPFMIQMMVENAIKHGISKLIAGGKIIISVFKEDSKMIVKVQNSGELGEKVDLGVGVQNIKQRLALQYGSNAKFELKQDGDMVTAKVTFENERI